MTPPRASGPFVPADEDRHVAPADEAWWQETWWFDGWRADGSLAVCTWLTLLPNQHRAWYWCQVVRPGEEHPLVHVAELDGTVPRQGLTVRWEGLWADHVCESPFDQWTVANETYAVALDDPSEALGRGYGVVVPLACDLEWYGIAEPLVRSATAYEQEGEVFGVIELGSSEIELEGRGRRGHSWGIGDWAVPAGPAPAADGARAPVLLRGLPTGDIVIEQVATLDGWQRWWRPV